MDVIDLGQMRYRDAWRVQEEAHDDVLAGGAERLFLVEHPPVITLGRRPGIAGNIIAPRDKLDRLGVEVVESDRGGDVTFHGPGQIVAYPILRLIDHGLSVGGYVRRLEEAVIAALTDVGVAARKDPEAIGVWVDRDDGRLAKICALGVRIRRGVSMHGIALNVTTDLRWFDLIVPCGLSGRAVTSLWELLGERTPPVDMVRSTLAMRLKAAFAGPTARSGSLGA